MSYPKKSLQEYGEVQEYIADSYYSVVQLRGTHAIKRMHLHKHEEIAFGEISIILSLSHPHIISIEDIIIDGTDIFIVMPAWGKNLRKTVIPFVERRSIMAQLITGLEYIHSKGILHLDLKPDNIMVNDLQIKIIDFGLSRQIHTAKYQTACTVWYRPPEKQLGYPLGYYTDVWSLGCILYELFIGKVLFPGDECDILKYIFNEFGTPTAELHPEALSYPKWSPNLKIKEPKMRFIKSLRETTDANTAETIESMLKFNPKERYSTIREVPQIHQQIPKYYHSGILRKIFLKMIKLKLPFDIYFRATLLSKMIKNADEDKSTIYALLYIADGFSSTYFKKSVCYKTVWELCRQMDYNTIPVTCYDVMDVSQSVKDLVRAQFAKEEDLSFMQGTPYE